MILCWLGITALFVAACGESVSPGASLSSGSDLTKENVAKPGPVPNQGPVADPAPDANQVPTTQHDQPLVNPSAASPEPVRMVGQARRYGSSLLAPPRQTDTPTIAGPKAWDIYWKSGLKRSWRGSTPNELVLVRFSDVVCGDIQPDGQVKLRFTDVLAWTVVVSGTDPVNHSPIGPNGGPGAVRRPGIRCTFLYVADAGTGAEMIARQECPP